MTCKEWEAALIKHFKSGNATDEQWEEIAVIINNAAEDGDIDNDLCEIINNIAVGDGADRSMLGDSIH